MSYDRKVFSNQFPLVKWFIYHLTYYRALHKAYNERKMKDEFWKMTIDAHLLIAAINWCMVFGSDSSNPTHWKQLSPTESTHKQFRAGLLNSVGISRPQWKRYWTSMTAFRNKYAAHRELSFTDPVPNFDIALKAALYYDQWVRTVISPDTLEEPPFDSFARSLPEIIAPFVEKLMLVGATMKS